MAVPVFKSVYPFTQETIAEYALLDEARLDLAVNAAARAYHVWKKTSFSTRAQIIRNVAALLRRDKESLATLITQEMGKVISESRGEVEKCALSAEYYADHAEEFLKDEIIRTEYSRSFVSYEPIGIVLGIMPWNFPFWQVFRYAVPTLMAGNVVLLKHAPNTSGCSHRLEKLFQEAGAAKGVFTSLIIDTPLVEKILSMNSVQAVTLTGSDRAGSAVASLAGQHIKKSVMELGGSDALLILPDADMKKAAEVALQSRMINAGQSCICAKRFIVVQEARDDFMQELLIQYQRLQQGDPFLPQTTTGPMARQDLVNHLVEQMNKSVLLGAKRIQGGEVSGCNFKPAILAEVKPGMPAFDEETFGPVAAVSVAADIAEAVRLANESSYGLSGSVWTRDIERGMEVARQMETGSVFINTLVKSDPTLPFGGTKKSGYGRELGRHGILEFVNAKTIAAQHRD